jgi:hypothetical protein
MTINLLSFQNLPIDKPLLNDKIFEVFLYKLDIIEKCHVMSANICFFNANNIIIEESNFISLNNSYLLVDKYTYNYKNELVRYYNYLKQSDSNDINNLPERKYIFIGGGVPFFFGHFIFEYLPRFEALYNSNYNLAEHEILVSQDFPQYCIDIINTIYENKFSFLKLYNTIKYNIKQVILISAPFSRLFDNKCTFLFADKEFYLLKNRLMKFVKITNNIYNKPYLLILSRSTNSIRLCKNIDVLITKINNNINNIHLIHINNIEDYDIVDQINIINGASFIIEEMGSGTPFTALVKREKSPWIIFGSNQFSAQAVRVLISILGNKPIFCSGAIIKSEGTYNHRTQSIEYNYNIDVDKIFQLIQKKLRIQE